jgi:hypothetical protein
MEPFRPRASCGDVRPLIHPDPSVHPSTAGSRCRLSAAGDRASIPDLRARLDDAVAAPRDLDIPTADLADLFVEQGPSRLVG